MSSAEENEWRPDPMRPALAELVETTALIFLLYNKFALPKEAAHELTPDSST